MEFPRLPRFRRARAVPSIEITPRDREILQRVYEHRFLRSSHLVGLLGQSSQQILRRLQLLYHHGYLERPRAQLDFYHSGGSRPFVYGLGKKGAALLRAELGLPCRNLDWSDKNRSVGRYFLQHALFVSDVMVNIELACRHSGRVLLLTEEELQPAKGQRKGRQSFRWNLNLTGSLKLGVIPDRVFALEYPDPSGKSDRAIFFLEADRGTMPVQRKNLSQTSLYRKLLAYEATWSQSLHRSRFGFHRFRVLFVTKSVERLNSLIEASARIKSGRGLFLFSHERSLANPDAVFTSLWHTGRQGEQNKLLP